MHGGLIKTQIALARELEPPDNDAALQTLVGECAAARKRHSNRSGYSPVQHVYGLNHRLPAALTSDDRLCPGMLACTPDAEIKRAMAM